MTKVVIVETTANIPQAAQKRGSHMEGGKKVIYIALDRYNGTKDEENFGLCGVEVHEFQSECRLTVDQIMYLWTRCRRASKTSDPTGGAICAWYVQDVGYFLAVGWVVLSSSQMAEMPRDKLIKMLEGALEEEFS